MEKIGYINKGRTEKPNKGKGNPDITDSRHSQPSLGWRDKARSGVSRSQTSAWSPRRNWSHREDTAKVRFH